MKMVEIGKCCKIISGSTPSRIISEFWNGQIHWFTPKDLSGLSSKYVFEAPEKITEKGFKGCSTTLISPNSLLFSSRAPIGHIAINKIECCTNQGFKSLIPGDNVDVEYLYYAIKRIVPQLQDLGNGATFKELSKSSFEKVFIPLPPLSTQKKIAAILDAADLYRQKTKTLIEKYNQLAQSLFLDMFGDPVNNQKNWQISQFGNIYKSLRYGTSTPPEYADDGIPFIRATNIKMGGVVEKGMVYISPREALKIEKCRLNEGDMIIVRSGANTGDCCRIPTKYHGAYGGFDMIIDIDDPNSTFYNFLLNTEGGKAILKPFTRRAGQPHLNSQQMFELEVMNPPITLQTQFANRIQLIEAQKQQAQSALQKAETLFNSLLQKAFKGELVS